LARLEHDGAHPALGEMQRGREPGIAGPDHAHVGARGLRKWRRRRSGRRCRGPQRGGERERFGHGPDNNGFAAPWAAVHSPLRSWRQLRGSDMSTQPRVIPNTIEALADAVYPSFAMLAGMELDLFTPLKDGPLSAEEI